MVEREDTPHETPFSKKISLPHYERLYYYFLHLEKRLTAAENGQAYLINEREHVPTDMSVASEERHQYQVRGRVLLDHWIEYCREDAESDGWLKNRDEDRPSQSIVVNVDPRSRKPSSFPTLSKFRSVTIIIAIVVAGCVVGFVWAFNLLKNLH